MFALHKSENITDTNLNEKFTYCNRFYQWNCNIHFSDYPMTGPLQLGNFENLTKSKCWQPFIFMQTKTSWTMSFCSHMLHQLQSTANEQWMSKASNCISSSITNIRKHSWCVKNIWVFDTPEVVEQYITWLKIQSLYFWHMELKWQIFY